MAYWIYKVNATNGPHQRAHGDWDDMFCDANPGAWGNKAWTRGWDSLTPGDTIIAHQTDRNELVGVATFERISRAGELILKPVEEIRAKVRPLKQSDPEIAVIDALRQGPIKTLYEISPTEAKRLLRAARNSTFAKKRRKPRSKAVHENA